MISTTEMRMSNLIIQNGKILKNRYGRTNECPNLNSCARIIIQAGSLKFKRNLPNSWTLINRVLSEKRLTVYK